MQPTHAPLGERREQSGQERRRQCWTSGEANCCASFGVGPISRERKHHGIQKKHKGESDVFRREA